MNPTYLQLSTVDVAKMLGVDRTSVRVWCKNGIINYTDVSDPRSSIPRYVISEDEVEKIKRAMKRHGKRHWTKHYNKTKYTRKKQVQDNSEKDSEVELPSFETLEQPVEDNNEEQIDNLSNDQDELILDKIKNTLIYIKEIKARLADIELEKANLLKELEESKKEVISFIE